MSKNVQFAGELKTVETVGAVVEFLRKFDNSAEVSEKVCYLITVPAGTVDMTIDFSEITTIKYLYMSADEDLVVKIGAPTDTGFTINGPSIIAGPVGPVYITTGTADTVIDFAAFGV